LTTEPSGVRTGQEGDAARMPGNVRLEVRANSARVSEVGRAWRRRVLTWGRPSPIALVAGILLVLGLRAGLGWAKTGEIEPIELQRARSEVTAIEQRLQRLVGQQAQLGQQRSRLETELALAAARLEASQREAEAAQGEVAAAERIAQDTRRELDLAAERLKLQVGLLAALGRGGLAPLVLHAIGSGGDLSARVTVALALVKEEKRRRDEISRLLEARSAALAALSRRRETLSAARLEVEQRRRELEATRARVVAALARLEGERRTGAIALAGARENEDRLERLRGAVARDATGVSRNARLLRGGMRWPVESRQVIGRFGPHRDPTYSTITVSHGVVLAARPGESVGAVASGEVAYGQFVKGYGNLVIVNHGGEIYSLYARLAGILVKAGERVTTGSPVGYVGRGDDGAGSLYLEMRVGREAEDPLTWLQPLGR